MSLSYLTILNVGGIINCQSIDLVIISVQEAIGDNFHSSSLELSTLANFFVATYYSLRGFTLAPNRLSKWKS